MNFTADSVKLRSKLQNEDFYFDIETPRGHFFAVLDFASHDYANLNATLKGKLETIVGSFASLSDFSNELFLAFLAKEINNFVSNLAEQSGGPDLLFSGALSLVSGNRLSYFLCGDVRIAILRGDRLLPLQAASPAQLGLANLEAPATDQVQAFTLGDADVVLIMTRGVAEVADNQELTAELMSLRESGPKSICDSLMKRSAAGSEDRTLVVISGPYERHSEVALPDLSAVTELQSSLAGLEARLDALAEVSHQMETLKADLRSKAPAIDVLELDEKLKGLSAVLASKAETAAVLGLQRDVLKLGLVSSAVEASDVTAATEVVTISPSTVTNVPPEIATISPPVPSPTSYTLKAALVVLAISLAAGFVGGWLYSRATRKSSEVWSVRTSGNQVVLSRLDGPSREDVTLNVTEPVKSTGEQRFSSFADAKQYIDTVTSGAAPAQTTPATASSDSVSPTVSEVTVKPGDSLKRLAQAYNVPPEKLMELNPTITRWPSIRIGQKIIVPAADSATAATPPPAAEQSPVNEPPANTTEVRVGPGDSLNQLARRFNTTADRLRELNPQITNWLRIQRGQKVVVPAPAGD